MLQRLKNLVQDPPPLLVFEISDEAVAGVRRHPKTLDVEGKARRDLMPGVLDPSPGRPNVQRPEELQNAVFALLGDLGAARRPDVALILPDGSSRLTVLDFDRLPNDGSERLNLIRWRLKKTVPFEIEHARLACQVWPAPNGLAVMVAATPAEVVHQYEAPFEAAGLWPGYVALSTTAALNMVPADEMTLFAKLGSGALTIAALEGGAVRMIRRVELPPRTDLSGPETLDDLVGDLFPTCVFVADNLGSAVNKVVVCGFGDLTGAALRRLPQELGCAVEPLRSPAGPVEGWDAGIWGYLSVN